MEWGSYAEVRREVAISRSTLGRLAAAKLIVARRLGKKTLIHLPSLHEFLRRLPEPKIAMDARAVRLHKKFGVERTHVAATGDVQTQEAQTAA